MCVGGCVCACVCWGVQTALAGDDGDVTIGRLSEILERVLTISSDASAELGATFYDICFRARQTTPLQQMAAAAAAAISAAIVAAAICSAAAVAAAAAPSIFCVVLLGRRSCSF